MKISKIFTSTNLFAGVHLRSYLFCAAMFIASVFWIGGIESADATNRTSTPVALASADFNEDGIADLAAAYADENSGFITLKTGNRNSADRSFSSSEKIRESVEAPDLVVAGDFNCDGHADVVTARRGGDAIYLFAGDGRGNLLAGGRRELSGKITEMISGEINRADGLPDIIVAVDDKVLVFESPEGAFRAEPETFNFSGKVSSIALGRLSQSDLFDLAVAAEHSAILVRGRDRKLSLDSSQRSKVPAPLIEQRKFDGLVVSAAVGDFDDSRNLALALLFSGGEIKTLSSSREQLGQWNSNDLYKAELNTMSQNSARLYAARSAVSPGDSLLLTDSTNRVLEIRIEKDAKRNSIVETKSLNFESTVISLLPLRLNNDAATDIVSLSADGTLNTRLSEPQNVLTVTNTNDSGAGSLRQAILDTNGTLTNTIVFNIPGSGVRTISPTSALPPLNAVTTIDGTTQPGYSGTPLIELEGSLAGEANGLVITSPNCAVRGLTINRFYRFNAGGQIRRGYQIYVDITSRNNVIAGNYIGTNAAGTATGSTVFSDLLRQGIYLENSPDNVIGGTSAADRNLISGLETRGIEINGVGSARTIIQGNYIGTDVTGNAPVGNNFYGISVFSPNNTIGGAVPGAGNVISKNRPYGIRFDSDLAGTVVQGNHIGVSADGTTAIPNFLSGISLGNNPNTTIGGTSPNARNVISGNPQKGIEISPSLVTGILVQGNYIGTNSAGTAAIPNGDGGITIAGGPVTIGGTVPGARNVISGNSGVGTSFGFGIAVYGSSQGSFIQGNYIGTNASGTGAIPNSGSGILVDGSRDFFIGGRDPGAGNLIAFNGRAGVYIALGFDVALYGNSIHSNNGLGIDLAPEGVTPNDAGDPDGGANLLQNYPVLSAAASNAQRTNVQGTLNSKINSTYTLDFYANPSCDPTNFGEGKTYLGSQSVVTNAGGNAAFNITLLAGAAGAQFVTATATDNVDNTSEFSPCIPVGALPGGNAVFDFDGDGKTDISIFRPSVGEWWYLKSSDGGNAAAQFGASTDKITPGDFTGDGKTDIAFWRPSNGFWFVLRSEDFSYYSFPFGTTGDIPAVGDFDADGKADATIFRPSNATWYISKSSGGTLIQQFGQNGDVPVASDYDGDGTADIAIYRVALGEWWIQRSTAGLIAFQFGNSSDKPVPGDFTGDGKADVALFRPSTGEWFVLRSENQSYYSFPFGTNGDVPAPGDYDGDGKFDASVFRPSNNTWYIQRTTAGTLIQAFGQNGDTPVPGAFVP